MTLVGLPAASAASRVIALSPHLAELSCAAGGCDKLVGAVAWSDYPESVAALPQVGDAWSVSPERVLTLQPDLVLAWDGGTPRETIERLRGLNMRVETIAIRRLDDVPGALRAIGGWLGTEATADAAARAYATRLLALRRRHANLAPVRVLYQIESNPPYSVNRDSPISEAITLCGGVNLFADLPALAAPVEREALLARDPEAILFTRQDDVEAIHAFWLRSPKVSATRRNALYVLDGNLLDRATPRLLDGVEQVCAALSDARAKASASRATAPRPNPSPAPVPAPSRKAGPKGG
ncbi:MAG TPA: ABC transporter substrate-binding protein [Verrucomicrobiae bacterium]|nr:ABC transporter substrate-binding protein [Verrucomicrobiae bacterium]